MFCPRCGLKLNDFDSFCPRCGTQVKESAYPPPENTGAFASQAPVAPAQPQAAPQQSAYSPHPQAATQQSAYAPQPQAAPQPDAYAPHPQAAPQPDAYAPHPQAAHQQSEYVPQPQYPAQYPQPGTYYYPPYDPNNYQPGAQMNAYPAYPQYPYPAYPYPAYPYPGYPYPYAPARPIAPPKPPDPNAKMKRAYNLMTLSSLIIFGAHSIIVEAGIVIIGVIAAILLGIDSGFSFDLGGLLGNVTDDIPAMFVITTLYAVLYALGMIGGIKLGGIIRKRVDVAPLEKRKLPFGQFAVIALICFGFWGIGVLIGNVGNLIAPVEAAGLGSSGWASIPEWLLAIVAAPLFEETIFRKFLIDRLHPFGERTAVIFSALLFGMAHQNGMQFFLAFFLGIIFAIVYLRTGNVIYTMILHCMINTVATADEIGCLIFGDVFDTWWLIACGVLMAAGIVTFFIVRKKPFFRLEPNHTEGANRAAFRPWGVILTRVLACVMIGVYGAIYLGYAIDAKYGWLSLLHIFPAVAAIVTVIVVSKKTSRTAVPLAVTASGAGEQTGYAPSARDDYDPLFGDRFAPPADDGDTIAPDEPGEQFAPPEPESADAPIVPAAPEAPTETVTPDEPTKAVAPDAPTETVAPAEPLPPSEPQNGEPDGQE